MSEIERSYRSYSSIFAKSGGALPDTTYPAEMEVAVDECILKYHEHIEHELELFFGSVLIDPRRDDIDKRDFTEVITPHNGERKFFYKDNPIMTVYPFFLARECLSIEFKIERHYAEGMFKVSVELF